MSPLARTQVRSRTRHSSIALSTHTVPCRAKHPRDAASVDPYRERVTDRHASWCLLERTDGQQTLSRNLLLLDACWNVQTLSRDLLLLDACWNVQTVNRRSAATCFFLMPAGTYRRSTDAQPHLLLLDACWNVQTVILRIPRWRHRENFLIGKPDKNFLIGKPDKVHFVIWEHLQQLFGALQLDLIEWALTLLRRFFTHFRLRSSWTMCSTDDFGTPISLEIWHMEQCVCGCPSWLRTSSSMDDTLSSVRADFGLPLPFFRSVVPVSRSFFRRFSNPCLF